MNVICQNNMLNHTVKKQKNTSMMLVIQAASLSPIGNSQPVVSGDFAGPQMLFKGLVELLGRKPRKRRARPGQWHSMGFWLAGTNKKARSSKKEGWKWSEISESFLGFLLRGCWWNPCIKRGCDRNFKDFFHDDSQTRTCLCLVRASRTFKGNSTSKSPEDVQVQKSLVCLWLICVNVTAKEICTRVTLTIFYVFPSESIQTAYSILCLADE